MRELRESPQPVEEEPERPERAPTLCTGRSGGCTEAVVEKGVRWIENKRTSSRRST